MARLSDVIAQEVISRLYGMMDIIDSDIDVSKVTINDGLKNTIINDPYVKIVRKGKSAFDVVAINDRVIAEAIVSDFILSHDRRSVQNEKKIKSITVGNKHSPAWDIITSYYLAFFCATDISRVLNYININLTNEEVAIIRRKGGFSQDELKDTNGFSGIVSQSFGRIRFNSSGARPHQFAWSNLKGSLKKIFNSHDDWPEVQVLSSILSGENGWEYPSSIRNEWNYIDPYLYGNKGIEIGREFLKISSNPQSSESWLLSNHSWRGKSHSAASIAVIAEILHKASNEAYSQFFIKS